MDYRIDGIGVGKDPDSFDRDNVYKENFIKIGNSKDNIKTIKNFISKEECESILSIIKKSNTTDTGTDPQWDGKFYTTPDVTTKLEPIVNEITKTIQDQYQVSVELIINGSIAVVRWTKGEKMSAHVDDLGIENYHITGLVYLNNDYEGGEINFITQDLTLKPDAGDLVMFPGNLHYAHEVKEITSGERFTIPVWYKYI
jgi:hypothetical protein